MATNLERIQAMMEEIGPAMAEIEAVIQSEEKNWAIQFEDQSIIMLEWAERPDRIVLSSMLGIPSETMQLCCISGHKLTIPFTIKGKIMGLNSIPPSSIANTEITVSEEKKSTSVENKSIKTLYGDQTKADMLSAYMSRMNSFYANVKQVIDQKKTELN
jgi:hypothetical protein